VVWKIKNFSSVRKKSYLQSDKFSFADFNWCVNPPPYQAALERQSARGTFALLTFLVVDRRFIGFYTDGDNDESRGYFSIYLFLDVNHMPKGKAVTIEYFLTFINHKDSDETVKKGSFK
jgi:hypothetical protein